MSSLEYSQGGQALTERFEGVRLQAYQDQVGVWTIGYGHTGTDVHPGMTITQEQAEMFLGQDIKAVVDAINRDITVPLTQGEFDALVDFGFNLGVSALEHSTLWKQLNAGQFDAAATQFPRWDMAGGQHIQGLLARRLAEQVEFKGASA